MKTFSEGAKSLYCAVCSLSPQSVFLVRGLQSVVRSL